MASSWSGADWLIGLGIAVVCMVASWVVLGPRARRLPPGIMRDLSAFVPDCVAAIRRLRNDPRVPRRAKIVIVFAGLWVASPIDLIPEFLPVIGPLDDIVVVALALRYAGRWVPRRVLLTAWPGEPHLLVRCSAGTAMTCPSTGPSGGHDTAAFRRRVRAVVFAQGSATDAFQSRDGFLVR